MHPLPLISNSDRRAARALVDSSCLRFEEGFDDLVGVFDGGQLCACGARAGRVLKMLVVAPEHRGTGLLAQVVSELMRRGCEAGVSGYFIYTRPATAAVFEGLAFKLLAATGRAVLLEHGNGLHRYLSERASKLRDGRNAAVVVNADPFTVGHLALVAQAATLADTVYVFVTSEGGFQLPLETRLELAAIGTAHLTNVVVTDTGPYVLGRATFPAYFLNQGEEIDLVRMELDAELFGKCLAAAFQIAIRVVGSEPTDPVSRRYNQCLRQRLTDWNIQLVEIERTRLGERWVDTRRARRALAAGDLAALGGLVPEGTLPCLGAATASVAATTAPGTKRGVSAEECQ